MSNEDKIWKSMEGKFEILKTYLKQVKYDTLAMPQVFFDEHADGNLKVAFTVNVKKNQKGELHLVDLWTTLQPTVDGTVEVSKLQVCYSALVCITDKNLSEEEYKRVLKEDVPQTMYNAIRALVWDITNASGCPPIMMTDYTFSQEKGEEGLNYVDETMDFEPEIIPKMLDSVDEKLDAILEDDSLILDYGWMLNVLSVIEGDTHFLETFKEACGSDLSSFQDTVMYKYFYRFLTPMEFLHPDFEQCEEDFWPMFFQLLLGEGEDVKVLMDENGKAELEFEWKQRERRKVSKLTLKELKEVLMDLTFQAFVQTGLEINDKIIKGVDVGHLQEGQIISKEDFLALYGCDEEYEGDIDEEAFGFVEGLYSRIEDCDAQTFPFRYLGA